MHYLIFYNYVVNMVELRSPYREAHLAYLTEFVACGELILAGAFTDPLDGATFLFKADNKSKVEDFINTDPYVVNGLVTEWKIRAWKIVLGSKLDQIVKLRL